MKNYDIIIIGGGGGLKLRAATEIGLKVAVIEKEALGGTCLNKGCIPSKMLIHTADLVEQLKDLSKFNIEMTSSSKVHFESLVKRVNQSITSDSKLIEEAYEKNDLVDFYHGHGKFIKPKIIQVNGEKITAEKIFIATGAKPNIPNITGLEGTPYMTSTEALKNTKLPKSMIVIGGGYIAVELGYFYGALGTKVTFLVRSDLLREVDSDIKERFQEAFMERYEVKTHHKVSEIHYSDKNEEFSVIAKNKDGKSIEFKSESLLLATGVIPNTENLGLENTAIRTNKKGFINVNEYLETEEKNIYALGDVIGKYLFRHSVNFEGEYLLRTLYENPVNEKISYSPMPYAVFSNPQIAGIGFTEEQLKKEKIDYIIGKNDYKNSAMGGDALQSKHGMVKLLFEKKSLKLLGAHIIGEEAATMIHMCIAYINMEATLDDMLKTIYIHPALPENIRNACRKAKSQV